jgi:hypothetical protein
VNTIRYLGIIFDNKMTFKEHVKYIEEKCTKLIFSLSRSAKLSWGLQHKALKTIYAGGTLPLILYGAPVWKGVMDTKCYKTKLIRTQRLINIRIDRAYRTVSNEALCVITGLIPIHIQIQEAEKKKKKVKGHGSLMDREKEMKHWIHTVVIIGGQEDVEYKIEAFTDGSKTEMGVGLGIVIYTDNYLTHEKV